MILETKLHLPQPKTGTIARSSLLELLKNNLDKKLILITADAGYGKTTLLGQLVKEARLPHTFYDLDKNDSDLIVFYAYLIHGIKQVDTALVKYSQKLLKSATADGGAGKNVELLFGTLINELCEKRKEELFVIVDNYHNIVEDSLVHRAMDLFIDRLPEKVHVIISTRSQLPLPSLARWRAKQDMFDVTREELAFTGEEIAALLKDVNKTSLADEDIRQIKEHTEGWITGIRLILQANGRGEKTIQQSIHDQMAAESAGGGLFEYFANDILSGEAEAMQNFLTKCSILETITPAVCDAIMKANNSEQVLKKLEKRHLFISAAGSGEYKYHHLFRDFLQGRLGDEKESLHLKAADYYKRRGNAEQAIEHLLMANSYELASKAILKAVDGMLSNARVNLLSNYLQRIPDWLSAKYPQLLIINAMLHRQKGCFERSFDLYDKAIQVIKERRSRIKSNADLSMALSDSLLGQAKLLLKWGKYDEIFDRLNEALRACPATKKELKGNIYNTMALAWQGFGDLDKSKTFLTKAKNIAILLKQQDTIVRIDSNWALLYYMTGDIKTAVKTYKSLLEQVGNKNYFLGIESLITTAANSAMIMGEFEWAGKCLDQGWKLVEAYDYGIASAMFKHSQATLFACQGQLPQAHQCLEAARRIVSEKNLKEREIVILKDIARIYRYQGNHEKALEFLEKALDKWRNIESKMRLNIDIEKVFIDAACGRWAEAEACAKKSLKIARKNGAKCEEFQALLSQTSCRLRDCKKRAAAGIMSRAVRMSRDNGYDGILIRELRYNQNLYELSGGLRDHANYLEKLRPVIVMRDSSGAIVRSNLNVLLFGVLRLCLPDGREMPVKWRSRKEVSLVAYLLLHRKRFCEREELMKALWPNAGLKQAEHSLHAWIFQAKKDLAAGIRKAGAQRLIHEPFIIHQERSYRIAPEILCCLDTEEYTERFNHAKTLEKEGKAEESMEMLRRCLELYQNDFLPNLGEQWCEEYREQFEKNRLACLMKLAAYCDGRHEYEETIAYYRQYLQKNPYDEEMRIRLWNNLKALGRGEEIQRDYREYQRILKKDLNEKPRPMVVKCYRDITGAPPE